MKCEICGKEMSHPCYAGEYAGVCNQCFNAKFWQLIVAEKDHHLVAEGECYSLGDEDAPAREPRGHDGRKFTYEDLATGEQHTTTNLWYQGDVPPEFRDQLPDTVRFVSL